MNNTVVPITSNVPRIYSASQLALVKNTVAKDTTDDEFNMFIEVCKNMNLDPFRRQLYCIVYSKDNPKYRKVAMITGIDGFRAIAERSGNYRPDDAAPVFDTDPGLKSDINPHGLISATVKTFKQDNEGHWFPVVGTVYWEEFAPVKDVWKNKQKTDKQELSGNWGKMPRVMLAKCAEAVALRKGWPEDLSGIHSAEEMEVVNNDLTASEAIEAFERDEKIKLIGANNSIAFHWTAGEPLEAVSIGMVADKCLSFIQAATSPIELETWRKVNRISLQEFWAENGNDALEVKAALESKLAELSA